MLSYLIRRAATLALVFLGLAVLIFIIARIVPGDPARIALGPLASPAQVEQMQIQMGLDQPFFGQLLNYLSGIAQGDLGKSLLTSRPVMDDILQVLPATLELVLFTIIIQILLAIPLGVIAAIYRNSWVDNLTRIISLIGVVTPGFVLAIGLQLMASYVFNGLPVTGRIDPSLDFKATPTGLILVDSLMVGRWDVFADALRHLLLPSVALAMAGIGQVMRITRSSMIEVEGKDFIEASRAYGIPERVIRFRYMLRLACVAPLTILGLEFASLIGNAFIVEFVFSWPGVASYGVRTILQKDLNAVIGVVLVSGVFFVVANLVVDALLGVIDPRHRLREKRSV